MAEQANLEVLALFSIMGTRGDSDVEGRHCKLNACFLLRRSRSIIGGDQDRFRKSGHIF